MLLSICMMVKNEEQNLNRCLKSLQPLRDAIDSELIIVDTGSEDETVKIAKQYSDNVYFHSWNNNFSEMRNITFGYAKGKWILIFDADEELGDCDSIIRFFKNNQYKQFNSASMTVKNLADNNREATYAKVQSVRLFNHEPKNVYYEGVVHNQLKYYGPVANLDSFLWHYGYVKTDKELMERKFERTASLLKKEIEINPHNIYYLYQLGVSYAMHGELETGREWVKKAFDEVVAQGSDWENNRYVLLYMPRLDISTGRFEEVLNYEEIILKYAEGYLDAHFYLAHVNVKCNNLEKATLQFFKYIEYYLLKENLPSLTDGRLVHYTINQFKDAIKGLLVVLEETNNRKMLLEYSIIGENECKDGEFLNLIVEYGMNEESILDLKAFYDHCVLENRDYLERLEQMLEDKKISIKEPLYLDCFSKGSRLFNINNHLRLGNQFSMDHYGILKEALVIDKVEYYMSDILYFSLKDITLFETILVNINQNRLNHWVSICINKFMRFKYDFLNLIKSHKLSNYKLIDRMKINQILRVLIFNNMLTSEESDFVLTSYCETGRMYVEKVYNPDLIENAELEYILNDEEKFFLYLARANQRKDNFKLYNEEILKATEIMPFDGIIEYFKREANKKYDSKFLQENLTKAFQKNDFEELKLIFDKLKIIDSLIEANYSMMAISSMERSNFSDAEGLLLEGIKAFPHSELLLSNLKMLYSMSNIPHLSEVIDYFLKVLNANTSTEGIIVPNILKDILNVKPITKVSDIYDCIIIIRKNVGGRDD